MIDLTPSSIATKLLPEDATAADRVIVEAMAECALAEVARTGGTPPAIWFAVERAMVSAATAVRKQHLVRCERAMKFIESLEDDDSDTLDDEALVEALDP